MTAHQPDLFDAPADERWGVCVHRKGAVDADVGACSPVGWRVPGAPACAWFFGREQLRLSLMNKPKTLWLKDTADG